LINNNKLFYLCNKADIQRRTIVQLLNSKVALTIVPQKLRTLQSCTME